MIALKTMAGLVHRLTRDEKILINETKERLRVDARTFVVQRGYMDLQRLEVYVHRNQLNEAR